MTDVFIRLKAFLSTKYCVVSDVEFFEKLFEFSSKLWFTEFVYVYTFQIYRVLGINFKSCFHFDGLGAKIVIFKSKFWKKKKKISYVKNEILVFLFLWTQKKYVCIEFDVLLGFKSQFYDQCGSLKQNLHFGSRLRFGGHILFNLIFSYFLFIFNSSS